MDTQKYFIIGTAGHIDHGKSAMVKALTGTDPDRLSEEQERGMTIDLGFAFLNEQIAIIDVPGHERFIKNMVAGVSTIDMVMMVIAADDGVMPQTREHLDILNVLNVKQGIIVISKADLVDDEWLEIVKEDISSLVQGTFLQDKPILPISSVKGTGIKELKQLLLDTVATLPPRKNRGVFWMPVDRSFSIKGFGTVVTGSVLSGSLQPGNVLDLLPEQKQVKVRGIQTHGKSTETIRLGERAAINLTNISKEEIIRGDVLASPEYFTPSNIFDAKLDVLKSAKKPLKNRSRVRVHIGTREVIGRIRILDRDLIAPGENGYVQLKLEQTAVAIRRDPFVIRQYSPVVTIGGGIILDTNPKHHKRFDHAILKKLQTLETENPLETLNILLMSNAELGMNLNDLEKQSGIEQETLNEYLEQMLNQEQIVNCGSSKKPQYFPATQLGQTRENILNLLQQFHESEPLKPGMNKAELKKATRSAILFEFILESLIDKELITITSNRVKLSSHQIKLNEKQEKISNQILEILTKSRYSPPGIEELAKVIGSPVQETENIIYALEGLNKVVRVEDNVYFTTTALKAAREKLINFIKQNKEITVSQYRDELDTSRKYAMALLLYFDNIGLTVRVEDVRILDQVI